MRGRRELQVTMLGFIDLETRVPPAHPLRTIKRLADAALAELSPLFDRMYAKGGRPSIRPRRLLKASLLMALYSVRSERAFCEELDYHLPLRWFLDMELAERDAVPRLIERAQERGSRPTTIGSDKAYDTADLVATTRARGVTPHVEQDTTRRRSAIDGRAHAPCGYAISQRIRKRVEEIFGWMKAIGGFRRRGLARSQLAAYLVGAAYNLVRLAGLIGANAAA